MGECKGQRNRRQGKPLPANEYLRENDDCGQHDNSPADAPKPDQYDHHAYCDKDVVEPSQEARLLAFFCRSRIRRRFLRAACCVPYRPRPDTLRREKPPGH